MGISAGQHLFAVVTALTEHRIVVRNQLAIVDAGCSDGARLDVGRAARGASRFYGKWSSDSPAGLPGDHDFVMLNALADTPATRGAIAQAVGALKSALG